MAKGSKQLLPCRSCPWRRDQNAAGIPGYNQAKAEGLVRTVGGGDAMRPIMACHHSTDKKPIACRGYLAREGWSNINVRILLARGMLVNPDEVLYACETIGVELEPDYHTVLEKLSCSAAHRTNNPVNADGGAE